MVGGAPLADGAEESFSTEVAEAEDLSMEVAEVGYLSMKVAEAEEFWMEAVVVEDSSTELAVESEVKLGRAELSERDDSVEEDSSTTELAADSVAEARRSPLLSSASEDAFRSFLVNPACGP